MNVNLKFDGSFVTRFICSKRVSVVSVGATILLLAYPIVGFGSDNIKTQKNSNQQVAKLGQPPSPLDLVIVQLTKGADREKFDDLLEEIHGTVIRTISAGPNLQFLVVQAEPGQAAEVEKRLSNCKEVARVERNQIYRIQNDVVALGSGGGFHLRFPRTRPPSRHMRFGKGFGFFGSPGTPPSPPPLPHDPQLSGTPNDPFYAGEWDLNAMNFVQARDSGNPISTPVALYFLDTGYTVSSESPASLIQLNFSDPFNPTGVQEALFDSGSHGTETASVTAFTDNNTGYAGCANLSGQRCMLTMCRISQDGATTVLLNIVTALSRIAQNPTLPRGPINISFNSGAPNTLNSSSTMQQLAWLLRSEGFLVVLAAGNESALDPSAEQAIRRVAATDQTGNLAWFSNFGPFPAAAPGNVVPVYTPANGPNFESFASGTSFAAPRWCAAIAVVMGVLSPATRSAPNADFYLLATGTQNPQGYKIPDLQAAVQMAAGH